MAQPLDTPFDSVRDEVLGSSRQLVDTSDPALNPITDLEIARERQATWRGIEGLDIAAATVRENFLFNAGTDWARRKGYIQSAEMGVEDSIFNKYIGFKFGEAYKADPDYYAYDPTIRQELNDGIPNQYQHYFDDTVSLGQAREVKRQLQEHLSDLKVLGHLGSEGGFGAKAASIGLSFLDPAQTAIAFASYGTTLAYSAVRAQRAAAAVAKASKAAPIGAEAAATVARVGPTLGATTGSLGGRAEPALGVGAPAAAEAVTALPGASTGATFGEFGLVKSAPAAEATMAPKPHLRAKSSAVMAESTILTEAEALKQLGVKVYPLVAAEAATVATVSTVATRTAAVAGSVISKAIPGIVEGAAQNVTYEAIKHRLDFEDNEGNAVYLSAAIWGAAFATPFSFTAAGSDALVRFTAAREARVLDMLREEKLNPALVNEPAHIQAKHEHAQMVKAAMQRETTAPGIPNTPEQMQQGFMAGSVGAAQAATFAPGGSQVFPKGDSRAAQIANSLIDNKINRLRLDWFWLGNKYPNPHIQQLGNMLIKDPVAGSRAYAQGRTASEDKYLITRRNAGSFHAVGLKSVRAAKQLGGWRWGKMRANTDQFYKDAGRLARGDTSVLGEVRNIPIAKQLQETADAAKAHVFNPLADDARKYGVDGADSLQGNSTYVNRVWDQDSIRTAVKAHGKDTVARVLAGAFATKRGAQVDMDVARNFLAAVRRLEHDNALDNVFSIGSRDAKLLREELDKAGLTPAQASAVIDTMFESKASGKSPDAANLKHRFDLDENHAMQLPDGAFLKVSDLLENDLRVLVDRYVNRMGGHIALAKKGIKNDADFEAVIKKADDWFAENQDSHGVSADQHKTAVQMRRDEYAHITGAPMSTFVFNKTSRFLTALKGFTRAALLGELGLPALFELKNAAALATLSSAMKHMPSLMTFIQAARTGDFSKTSELAQVVQHMTGNGSERAASYARQSLITEHTYAKDLTRWENLGREASHAVDIMAGNATITAATRHMAATMHAQKYIDIALGRKGVATVAKIKARAVGQGINIDDFDDVMADLKLHTEVNKHSGQGESIDYETWKKANPDTYDSFVTAVMRDAREGIQDLDLGETAAFTHNPVGNFFGELRSFSLGGHGKQFLKGLHYRDSITATQWSIGLIGEAMAYTLQTSINYAQSPEELDKRLTLDAISRAAVSRLSVLGILPMVIDTPAEMFLGHPILNPGGTNNTGNRNFLVTPSMAVAGRAVTALKSAGQALSPSEEAVVTRKEAYDSTGFLPFSNFWGVRNLRNMFADEFPASEPAKQ